MKEDTPMTFLRLGRWAILILLATVSLGNAADPLTPAQKDAVREVVREYLINNPEVLIDALQAYQARAAEETQKQQQAALSQFREQLERDPTSPVVGAANGDVTIVEFLDYRCTYCKKVFPAIQELLKNDGNIRYVVKELPILSPESVVAAKAALAVWRKTPAKYMAFHTALMTARGTLSDTRILEIAGEVGLDAKAVGAAMKDPEINAALAKNHELAQSLNIQGTPAFVVGGRLVPGAVGVDALRELVAAARKG
jgi:protein-disulfide isomerase